MDMRKNLLGEEHPDTVPVTVPVTDTLTSMPNLASTYRDYRNQGRRNEAEQLEVRVMDMPVREELLGAEHPDTLTSKANLASTYKNQGTSRWNEAEQLEVRVKDIMRRTWSCLVQKQQNIQTPSQVRQI
jgi:hypothetical protein